MKSKYQYNIMADRMRVLIYHFSLVSVQSKLGYFKSRLPYYYQIWKLHVTVGVHGVGLNWVLKCDYHVACKLTSCTRTAVPTFQPCYTTWHSL